MLCSLLLNVYSLFFTLPFWVIGLSAIYTLWFTYALHRKNKCEHYWINLDTVYENGRIFEKKFCLKCDKEEIRNLWENV